MGVLPVPQVWRQVSPWAPVRRFQNIAFRNKRLSLAGRPFFSGPPGKCGSVSSQTRSETSWRRCGAVVSPLITFTLQSAICHHLVILTTPPVAFLKISLRRDNPGEHSLLTRSGWRSMVRSHFLGSPDSTMTRAGIAATLANAREEYDSASVGHYGKNCDIAQWLALFFGTRRF